MVKNSKKMTKNGQKMSILKKSFEKKNFSCSESIENKQKAFVVKTLILNFFEKMVKNGQKMTKNDQKWSEMNIFEKRNRNFF